MMKKIALIAGLAVLLLPLSTQLARATSDLTCMVGSQNVLDIAPIKKGSTVDCGAATSNTSAATLQITVTDPLGGTNTQTFGSTTGTVSFPADKVGVWKVEADWFGSGKLVQKEIINLQVSFLVLPESPIGTAALIGSSLAAFGGFMALRHRGTKP